MRRFAIVFLVLGFTVALAAPARAGAVNLLSLDGVPDVLEDNDWETFVENDVLPAGTLDIGEFIVGMFEIDNINGTSVSNSTGTFVGVFATKVATKVLGGTFTALGGFTYTLTAPTAAEYASLQTLFPNLPDRNSVNTMLQLFDDQNSPVGINENNLTNRSVNDALSQAVDGALVAEFGLRDGDELYRLDTDTDVIDLINSVQFAAALNVTHNEMGLQFIDVPATIAGGLNFPDQPLPAAELHINPGAIDNTLPGSDHPDSRPRGPFEIGTDANIQVNVIPEPGSLTLLVIGVAGLGVAARRRRRTTKETAA